MANHIQRVKGAVKQRFPAIVPLVRRLKRQLKPDRTDAAPALPIAEVFSRVYDTNYWANSHSRSGNGSDLSRTAAIRAEIPRLIRDYKIVSMLDAPCGDFFWMRECELSVQAYIGADIVPGMIDDLNARFGNSNRRFECLDLTKDPLPRVDLVLCRDALVHFSFRDIRRALANLKRSGSTYLLTTTFTGRAENFDTTTSGNWRPLNLQIYPFSFPPPLRLINEKCTEGNNEFTDKSLGLWAIADL